MSRNFLKELPKLIETGILSEEKASEIRDYYQHKSSSSQNRLLIVFGILGAILVGLGMILIIAHNWDDFSRSVKTGFAFLPLLIGQSLCGYALLKKSTQTSWLESTSVLLFFAVGASISLISQIYNIPGNLSSFLLTWMLLCLPLIYLMKSSVTSLMVITGITYYACETSYWTHLHKESFSYWLVMASILPYYFRLFRKSPGSNFFIFHSWFIVLSFIICLGTISKTTEELMYIAYFSLLGLFHQIGGGNYFMRQPIRNNSFLVLGSFGQVIVLLMLSFDWFWNKLSGIENLFASTTELYVTLAITLATIVSLILRIKSNHWKKLSLSEISFIIFILIFLIGIASALTSIVLINLFILLLGVATIKKGAERDHLGILNYGLLILTALMVCRFFDTDISFVMRGLLFLLVGTGFFITNYWMMKKRKSHEK